YSSVSTSEKRTVSFNETIVSPGNVYELGLLPTDLNWYLGIWHKEDIFKQFIWVANRDKPFSISTGTLKFSENNLVLSDKDNSHVWSANMNRGGVRSPMVAELLDNGNFVVKDSNNDEVLWQTFDYPTDTLLPEMKLGRDKKTGINKVLTSWHPDDPSRIGYSLQVKNQAGLFELSVCGQDTSKCFYRSDPWDGRRFGDIPLDFSPNYVSPNWTRNVEDSNFTFLMTGQNNNSILTMEGRLPQILTWEPELMMWSLSWHPSDFYSEYQLCGPNSYSSRTTTFSVCTCIKGFDPAFHENWSLRDWRAYAYVTILKGHAGCVMWTGALNDFQNYSVGGRDLYVKVAAAIDHGDETNQTITTKNTKNKGMGRTLEVTVIIIIGVVVVALATFATYYYWKQHNRRTIITHGGPSKTMIMNEIARQTRCEFMNLVWRHFDEGNILHVVDPNFVDSSLVEEELWRTIQVGLLCVQNDEDDRPSTESVALMLSTSTMEIPLPKKPNYFYARLIGEDPRYKKVTLSGLLNFIDGLWSSCGDERIIIFTTNYKEKLDAALLRPGRMDMHIHMSYCTPSTFKALASNYLEIKEHRLFSKIEECIEATEVSPAEVAEQLMRNDSVDKVLEGLIEFLKVKKIENEQDKAKKEKEELENKEKTNKGKDSGVKKSTEEVEEQLVRNDRVDKILEGLVELLKVKKIENDQDKSQT
ncbi:unnamed protein product, partial [Arabidopsis halleri]